MKKIYSLLFAGLATFTSTAQIHVGPGQTYADIGAAANANVITAGDTVYLHAGTYPAGQWLTYDFAGTANQWITIRSFKNDSVSLTGGWTFLKAKYLKLYGLNWDGTNPTNIAHMLFFNYDYNCFSTINNIIVENCKFINHKMPSSTSYAGIKFTGTDNFQVINCLFKDALNTADGISINACKNGLIKNCRFENLGVIAGGVGTTYGSHCKLGAENITYQQNFFLNCSETGIVIGGSGGGQFFCTTPVGGTATFQVKGTKVFSNIFIGGRTGFQFRSSMDAEVINNTSVGHTNFATRCLDENGGSFPMTGNKIYNNIFSQAGGPYINGGSPTSGYDFKNNLFSDPNNPAYNSIYWGDVPNATKSGNITGVPNFTNAALYDFSLQSNSPAKGAGINYPANTKDYKGNNFNPTTRSIGAIEFAGLVGISQDVEDANNIAIYPNPSNGVFNVSWTGLGNIQRVEVYNTLGQIILSQSILNYMSTIDLSAANKGLYKAVFYTNKGTLFATNLLVN